MNFKQSLIKQLINKGYIKQAKVIEYNFDTFVVDDQEFSILISDDNTMIQIHSIHPYDNANYHWAKSIDGGKIFKLFNPDSDISIDNISGTKEEIAEKLLELDENIKSKKII